MKEIIPSYKISLIIMRYHARWCSLFTMLIMFLIYAIYLLVMKIKGLPLDYLFFQKHPHQTFYVALLIYAGPLNVLITRKLLHHRFDTFRLAVLAEESKINQNYQSESWN